MKIENSWVNLTLVKIEAGIMRVMALKEYNTGRVFRLNVNINELDQIILPGEDEYYIIVEVNKEISELLVDDRAPEFEIKYMTLHDYYIWRFHTFLDLENTSLQVKNEIIIDLTNEISNIIKKLK